ELQGARTAGMEPCRAAGHDLETAGGNAERRQQRHHVGLGIEGIDALGPAVPMPADALRPCRAATDGGSLDRLAFRLVRGEGLADLEEGDIAEPTIRIALGG